MTDLIVVGSFVVGMTVRLPRMPAPGETLVADLFDLGVGGKGANLAVAAARQEKDVAIVARVGDDSFAEMAYDLFCREGIEHSGLLRTPGERTAVGLVYLQVSGENTIGLYRGANWRLAPEDVLPHLDRLADARILATQLETPDETVLAAAQAARHNGKTVILNPAPARRLERELLACADILTPNESEARILAGLRPNDDAIGMVDVARVLMSLGARQVIVTLGAQGCLVVQPGTEPVYLPAFPVTPVDTVGAGDAFNGGLAVALLDGRSLIDAAAWANITAALSTTAMGAAAGLPSRAAVVACWRH